jgi:hypothetical protein
MYTLLAKLAEIVASFGKGFLGDRDSETGVRQS